LWRIAILKKKDDMWVLTCSSHVSVAGVAGGGGTKRKRRENGVYPQCKGCSRPPSYECQNESRRRYKEQGKLEKLKSKIEEKKTKAGSSKKKKRKIK